MTSPEQPGPDTGQQLDELSTGDRGEQGTIGDVETSHPEELRPRPAIWVGSWLDYNNGILHGNWIHADQDDAAIAVAVRTMLAGSPITAQTGEVAEDWGIFDHDNFGPLQIGEQESIAWVGAVGRGIAEHGPAFAAYADAVEELDALTGFTDDYLGQHDSVEAYAANFVDDTGYNQLLDEALPDCIRAYVRLDTDAIARDMQAGGDLHVIPNGTGGVWLFAAR